MTNYIERQEDISKAVRLLRQRGVRVGLPMQTASGEIIFPVDEFTITAAQIRELLDRDELNYEGILKLAK